MLRNAQTGEIHSTLVRIRRPILRIPTLAIHLERTVNSDGFKFNPETQLAPLLASTVKASVVLFFVVSKVFIYLAIENSHTESQRPMQTSHAIIRPCSTC